MDETAPIRSKTTPPCPGLNPGAGTVPGPLDQSQRLIVGLRDWTDFATAEQQEFLTMVADGWFGGVILFGQNCITPAQVYGLTQQLHRAAGGRPFWISIDQEGGAVARLNEIFTPPVPTNAILGDTESPAGPLAAAYFHQQARDLAGLGMTLNFSPVVDLQLGSPPIMKKGRSFSRDPETVIGWSRLVIQAHRHHGVMPCLKHFPGHGAVPVDTHADFYDIADTHNLCELLPYQILHPEFPDIPIMVAHLRHRDVDPYLPATLSPRWVPYFKQHLSPQAVLISDDLSMGALASFGTPASVLKLGLQGPMTFLIFSQNPLANARRMTQNYESQASLIPFDRFPQILGQV